MGRGDKQRAKKKAQLAAKRSARGLADAGLLDQAGAKGFDPKSIKASVSPDVATMAAGAGVAAASPAGDASRHVASELAKFMKGKGSAVKAAVDEAVNAGGFPTDDKGIRGLLSSLGIDIGKTQPIIDAKSGKRAPGLKFWKKDVLADLNTLMKGGTKPELIRKELATVVGLTGPMYAGAKDWKGKVEAALEGGKTGFFKSAKSVGKGLLLAYGAEMLLDPLIQKFMTEPQEQKKAKRAADLSASEMVEDYELSRLIDSQAMSALQNFPSASESFLGRLGNSGQGQATGNQSQGQGPALPGEMYLPGAQSEAAGASASPFDELTQI